MDGTHPEILYKLQQLRAQELQQQAANARFANEYGQAWLSGWGHYASAVSALIAKGSLLMTGQVRKPVESCC